MAIRWILALSSLSCAAAHNEDVMRMRVQGDPRAECYAACSATDLGCKRTCDERGSKNAGTIPVDVGTSGSK